MTFPWGIFRTPLFPHILQISSEPNIAVFLLFNGGFRRHFLIQSRQYSCLVVQLLPQMKYCFLGYGMFINRTDSNNIYITLWFKSPPPVFLRYGIFEEQTLTCSSRIWLSSSTLSSLWMVWVAFEVSLKKKFWGCQISISHFRKNSINCKNSIAWWYANNSDNFWW